MTRPRYETPEDRSRELVAATTLANHFTNTSIKKLPKNDRADFLLMADGVDVGYIEVKTRTCASTTYPTYHVSKDKLLALEAKAEKDGLRAMLLVSWVDRIGFIGVTRLLAEATFKQGGRWDRNDPADVEEMADIPINKFKFLN